jgi:hypothetical protein
VTIREGLLQNHPDDPGLLTEDCPPAHLDLRGAEARL